MTKCADAIPLHRLANQYQRLGIPMLRSTLTDLFHATVEKLAPLSQRMLQLVRESAIVQADETSFQVTTPGFTDRYLRHINGNADTAVVNGGSRRAHEGRRDVHDPSGPGQRVLLLVRIGQLPGRVPAPRQLARDEDRR